MRQVMPHRNNMYTRRNRCKAILGCEGVIVGAATILQHSIGTRRSLLKNIRM